MIRIDDERRNPANPPCDVKEVHDVQTDDSCNHIVDKGNKDTVDRTRCNHGKVAFDDRSRCVIAKFPHQFSNALGVSDGGETDSCHEDLQIELP